MVGNTQSSTHAEALPAQQLCGEALLVLFIWLELSAHFYAVFILSPPASRAGTSRPELLAARGAAACEAPAAAQRSPL